jgi:tight adherence protein C
MDSLSKRTILIAASVFLALAIAIGVYSLARTQATSQPDVGVRGLKRRATLESSGGFRLIEPIMRFVAGLVAALPVDSLRTRLREQLTHAGDYAGLTPDEYVALSFLSGALFAALAGCAHAFLDSGLNPILAIMLVAIGAALPYMQVQGEIDRRFKQVNRGLPFAIDLASLAMGAGLDFPGALRQVTDKSPDKKDAIHEELTRILNEIDLGHTRRQALEGFAERCPTESVKDFVASVVQSEEKGNPLSEVLSIQANMLRMRRSVAAEEAAARAGVLMIGPLMLIFGCIMLLILGPFIVTSMSGQGL